MYLKQYEHYEIHGLVNKSIMDEQYYNNSIKSLFDEEQQPTKAYKVKEMKNGVSIRLEGYPIQNERRNTYLIQFH